MFRKLFASFRTQPLPKVGFVMLFSGGAWASAQLVEEGRWASGEEVARLQRQYGGKVPEGCPVAHITSMAGTQEPDDPDFHWDFEAGQWRHRKGYLAPRQPV